MRLTINELLDCYAGMAEEAYDQGELEIGSTYNNVIEDLRTLLAGGMPQRLVKWLDPQGNWMPHEDRKPL